MKYYVPFFILLLAAFNASAVLPPISGPTSVCGGSTITLTNATTGGTWSSGTTSVATIGASTGIVVGGSITATGTTTITYTVGAESVYYTITVNPTPFIMGASVFCPGYLADTFTASLPGGMWTCDSVAADSIGPTGLLYHTMPGPGPMLMTDTVRYIMPSGCMAKRHVHVNPYMGLSVPISVCAGLPTMLTSGFPGYWTSGTPTVATILLPDTLLGLAEGSAAIAFMAAKTPAPGYCPISGFGPTIWTGISTSSITEPPATACLGPTINTNVCSPAPTYSITTNFGDGFTDVSAVPLGGSHSVAHAYSAPGTYTIKQKLYNGTTLLDSSLHSYTYAHCNTLPVKIYNDNNGNCTYDGYDIYSYFPCRIRVDSAGIPVDTLPAVSGLYYKAYGPAGTVYAFSIISMSSNMTVSCPSSGIIYDTISPSVVIYPEKSFGLQCVTGSGHDLKVWGSTLWRPNDGFAQIHVQNSTCTAVTPVVSMSFSSKYSLSSASPTPASVTGNTITWNLASTTAFNAAPPPIFASFVTSGPTRVPGDSVRSAFMVTPIIGDIYTSNNNFNDTNIIRGPYDPNDITVSPSGFVPSGTVLDYTVRFENMGNDTAHNVYVLDTVSANLDMNSLEILASSARMDIAFMNAGGLNIIKFDFPNIKLLDSSFHNECQGSFRFRMKTKDGLADGTLIPHRVGIYFDGNDVVMTNNAQDTIGIPAPPPPVSVGDAAMGVKIYPNPAREQLAITTTAANNYSSFTITNAVGQVYVRQQISGTHTIVDIKTLPAGIYYVTLKGGNGNQVQRFVKL